MQPSPMSISNNNPEKKQQPTQSARIYPTYEHSLWNFPPKPQHPKDNANNLFESFPFPSKTENPAT